MNIYLAIIQQPDSIIRYITQNSVFFYNIAGPQLGSQIKCSSKIRNAYAKRYLMPIDRIIKGGNQLSIDSYAQIS